MVPPMSAAAMLSIYRRLQPVLAAMDLAVDRLDMSSRGSLRLETDSGAAIELGRGSEDELLARCERFARTYAQVAARWQQPLEYADLRHSGGYAVKLKGVSTSADGTAKPARK